MYLLFDNSSATEIVIFYSQAGTSVQERRFERSSAGSLLRALHDLLLDLGLDKSVLQGVATLVGQGRFTATRVAVTVANTLAFALKIPVIAVLSTEGLAWVAALKKQLVGTYVLPEYSGPPRLGGKDVSYDV